MFSKTEKVTTEKFDIIVEGKSLAIKASKYQTHNNEVRFRVSINDSPIYIFVYNEDLNKAVAIDQSSEIAAISPHIEEVIGTRLAAAA